MSTYTDPIAAVEEASFMALRLQQTVFVVDGGNGQFRVTRGHTAGDNILEIINPPKLETIRV